MKRKKSKAGKLKRIRKKLHNAVLWTITELAAMAALLGAIIADSENIWIPLTLIGGGIGWLLIFNYANDGVFQERKEK